MAKSNVVVLVIVEGWGIAPATEANAIAIAKPATYENLVHSYPVFALRTKCGVPVSSADGYEMLGSDIVPFLKEGLVNYMAVSSMVGLNNLRQYFFDKQISPDNEICITDSADAPQMIAKIIETTVELVLAEKTEFVVVSIPQINESAEEGNVANTVADIIAFDESLTTLVDAVLAKHGTLIITSTHGNAEQMYDVVTDMPIGCTSNAVPALIVRGDLQGRSGGYDDSQINDVTVLNVSGELSRVSATILHDFGSDKTDIVATSLI